MTSQSATSHFREIEKILPKKPTLEGAGVRLHRLFGFSEQNTFDPFLLLDDFSSNFYEDYIAGFPRHPHRGIETITYMLEGEVDHEDSLGNKGTIHPGEVQWMTAGSGIIHQEMPQKSDGWLKGFQLWANLPKAQKMMDPRYRTIHAEEIPTIDLEDKVNIRIIAGKIEETEGPVRDIVTRPEYFDVTMSADAHWEYAVPTKFTCLIYIYIYHRS